MLLCGGCKPEAALRVWKGLKDGCHVRLASLGMAGEAVYASALLLLLNKE